jgi:hypothetical protein
MVPAHADPARLVCLGAHAHLASLNVVATYAAFRPVEKCFALSLPVVHVDAPPPVRDIFHGKQRYCGQTKRTRAERTIVCTIKVSKLSDRGMCNMHLDAAKTKKSEHRMMKPSIPAGFRGSYFDFERIS